MISSRFNKTATGEAYETLAQQFLEQNGLTLVERNYRCTQGEIDLIMRKDEIIVFVEVRYRSPNRFSTGLGSIDSRKCRKIATAAAHYLQRSGLSRRCTSRFDIISICGPGFEHVNWIPSAFTLDDCSSRL